MADDAAALLDCLEIDRAHVVGVSMGGMIAQSVAIQHPGKVSSLTSIMSNTGDRRYGRVHPKLITKVNKLRSKCRDDFIDKQVLIFRLISGDHFDEAGDPHAGGRGAGPRLRPRRGRRTR